MKYNTFTVNDETYDVTLTTYGWSYVQIILYESNRSWFDRFFNNGRLFSIPVTTHNKFPNAISPSDIRGMARPEFIEKIVVPAIKAYKTQLEVDKSWK